MAKWHFISNHGAALVYVAAHPRATGIEIAGAIGIQERNVRRIIADLVDEGYLEKERVGRVNLYEVKLHMRLRRSMVGNVTVGDLIKTLTPLIEKEKEEDA